MPDSLARKAFPGILRSYMNNTGISQVDIAKRLHVSKQTVSEWVNGKKFPRVDKMQELANMFGVLMSEMYTPVDSSLTAEYLNKQEMRLVTAYRGAEPPIQTAALRMLEDSAQAQREKRGESEEERMA